MVNNCTKFVQTLLFPSVCVLCGGNGQPQRDLCRDCERELPWLRQGCSRCARPMAAGDGSICGACLRRPPAFDSTIAALHYHRPVDELIRRLKFNQHLQYARLCGSLLAEQVQARNAALPQALVPVPLHPARQRQRGFNQAIELARPAARALGIALATGCCRRIRATETQSLLARRARHANLRGAFRMSGKPPGSHVAIVDDVMTTASTARALAETLRAAGVQRIDVWCVARADHH